MSDQDITPLKEAGAELGSKYSTYWTEQLVQKIQEYIDLQVETLEVLAKGDFLAAEACANRSNESLQGIAEHIGSDYMGVMTTRSEEIARSLLGA